MVSKIGKMRTHFKNKRGKMGLDIPEAKREKYGKIKTGSGRF